jgi:hypothetical protein
VKIAAKNSRKEAATIRLIEFFSFHFPTGAVAKLFPFFQHFAPPSGQLLKLSVEG